MGINISMVLDETGSMETCRQAVIDGFNEYIADQLKQPGSDSVTFSLVLFNSDKIEERYDSIVLKDIKSLTMPTYVPESTTPLYDAVARSIKQMDDRLARTNSGEKPSVFFVVFTDGLENASKEFTQQDVFNLISSHTAQGWTFIYLGANQDAWAVGRQLGFASGNTMVYDTTATVQSMGYVSQVTSAYRTRGGAQTAAGFADAGLGPQNFQPSMRSNRTIVNKTKQEIAKEKLMEQNKLRK